jgi:hypothetical protein
LQGGIKVVTGILLLAGFALSLRNYFVSRSDLLGSIALFYAAWAVSRSLVWVSWQAGPLQSALYSVGYALIPVAAYLALRVAHRFSPVPGPVDLLLKAAAAAAFLSALPGLEHLLRLGLGFNAVVGLLYLYAALNFARGSAGSPRGSAGSPLRWRLVLSAIASVFFALWALRPMLEPNMAAAALYYRSVDSTAIGALLYLIALATPIQPPAGRESRAAS